MAIRYFLLLFKGELFVFLLVNNNFYPVIYNANKQD